MNTDPNSPPENVDPGSGPREIVSQRLFSVTRERLFGAFADPKQLAQWWGPKGFTNTFREFDFRPGGAWRFVMHGPDGATYENTKEFTEVVPPERIVFLHRQPMHGFRMTMSFEEAPGGSQLTWQMLFESAAENEKLRSFIAEANEQNFDRLAALLENTSA